MNLCDINVIKELMRAFGLNFRKEFGQNFLTDASVTETIAEECCFCKSKTVLEIGAGIGTLTRELAERYQKVVSFEIDKSLIPVLRYTLDGLDNVTLLCEDFMKNNISATLAPYLDGGISVCANLPYYITTPVLMRLLECGVPFDYITIMVQSEVADRLCASAGSSEYGSITAALNYYGEAERILTVTADRFVPPPKVDSAVVRIKLYKDKPVNPKSEKFMFRVIRAAFEQRRKTLLNALSNGFPELEKSDIADAIAKCDLRPDIRGERLDTSTFAHMSDILLDHIGKSDK